MKHLFGVINVETIWRQHVPRSQISSEFCSNLFGQGRSLGCRGVKVEAVPWLKQLSIPQTCVQRCPWGYGGGHQASTSCHCHTLSSHTHLPRGQAPPLAGSAASSSCQLSHLPFQDTPHHRFRADRAQAPSSKSSGICVTRADGIFPDSRASTGALWVPSCLCIGILDTAKLKSLWRQYWEFWTGKHLFFSECHKEELPKSPCRADAVPVLVLLRSRGYAHLFGHGKVQANCLNLC